MQPVLAVLPELVALRPEQVAAPPLGPVARARPARGLLKLLAAPDRGALPRPARSGLGARRPRQEVRVGLVLSQPLDRPRDPTCRPSASQWKSSAARGFAARSRPLRLS